MHNCPHCGANLLPGAPNCLYCDQPVPAARTPTPPRFPTSPQPAAPAPQPARAPVQQPARAPVQQPARPPAQVQPQWQGARAPAQVQPQWQAARPPAHQYQQYQAPSFGVPGAGIPAETPNFMAWFIVGLVSFLICSVAIPGLIGGFMALTAKNEWDRGQYDTALAKLRTVKILVILNFAIGAMCVLVWFLFFFVAAVQG